MKNLNHELDVKLYLCTYMRDLVLGMTFCDDTSAK